MSTPAPGELLDEVKPLDETHPQSKAAQQKNAVIEKIRPELNLEKWAVWQPAKSKHDPVERILQREITDASGNKVSARVEIGFTNKGSLTTEDQRTYYALIEHWGDKGRTRDQTFFSMRYLARRLRKKWGTNVIDSLTESLLRLRTVPFVWSNSYFDASTKETIEMLDTFTILSELRIVKRKTDGVVNKEIGYFKFNDFTLNNLFANHTKPLLFETVLSFESEVAQIFYTHLDLIMADKSSYERRTKELFEDLGLGGKAYANRSNRKQVLERALRELQGAPLTTGRIVSAELEMTKDKKDYKVVIRKGPRQALLPDADATDSDRGEPASSAQQQRKSEAMLQAEELVRYFYRVFHGVDTARPVYPAVGQAVTLIAQHGIEKAKYVVDFASHVAPQTKYVPETFGGILHYTSRAIADFERRKIERKRLEQNQRQEGEQHTQQEAQVQAQREADAKAQAYLDQLTPEDRQKLYDQLVAEMRSKHAFLADWNGPGFDAFMRRAMLNHAREILARQTDQT
jgi:hypothetical protein